MTSRYPEAKRGDRLSKITAAEWNLVFNAARQVGGLQVMPPLRIRKEKEGIVISVDLPGVTSVESAAESTMGFGIIIDSVPASSPSSKVLEVQEVDLLEDGTYGPIPDRATRKDVFCWPNMKAADYLVLKNMAPANIVELKVINGKLYAAHNFRARIVRPNTGYGASDCPI